jgi:hypothetical protein
MTGLVMAMWRLVDFPNLRFFNPLFDLTMENRHSNRRIAKS